MKKIEVYTNLVYGGWSPKQLETGIGGSEEKLIEWAREMAKSNDVTIYMNGEHGDFDGVKYRDHREFNPLVKRDVFISFKARNILTNSIYADKIYHFTTEIEPEWANYELNSVDAIFTISHYHERNMRPASDKFKTMYLWADLDRMDANKVEEKEEDSMLYSSSFDRGLEELLVNWVKVKEKLGVKKLYITYGWDFMINLLKSNPHLYKWKEKMDVLIKQEGVELVGRLTNDEMCQMYWKCKYWALPLNNPNSELFCINAVKAQYAGCIPVVRKIGALQETVNESINWDWILDRPNHINSFTEDGIVNNRNHAMKFNLNDAIEEWNKLI